MLGLILTGAALQGASVQTSLLLLAYAAGAATSLALALLVGGRVFAAMKRSLGVGEWIRRGLGVAVLLAVVAIALGLRHRIPHPGVARQHGLARAGPARQVPCRPGSRRCRQRTGVMTGAPAMMTANPAMMMSGSMSKPKPAVPSLPVEGELPSLAGAVEWLNSPPLTREGLKGKVVLVDFWTYSCINCLRAIPYVRAWAEKYKDQGLVVIGVHAPEFAFEKNIDNVRKAVADLDDRPIPSPSTTTMRSGAPSTTSTGRRIISSMREGRIRHHHFGEGDYDESERVIQQLLAEAGKTGRAGEPRRRQRLGRRSRRRHGGRPIAGDLCRL